MTATVQLDVSGSLAVFTLGNPGKRNAMTRAMWRALRSAATALPAGTRCLLLRGEGGHFSAGGDITEYPGFRFDAATLRHFHEEEVAPALDALLAIDVPLVAQIEGNCMGGGLEIAACCDIRIAHEAASFGAPIAKLGMPMAPREMALLLRTAGETTVREMLLEARMLDAATLLARGFLTRVVLGAAQQAQESAQRIASLSPQAARLNKQAMRQLLMPNWPIAGVNTAYKAIKSIATENLDDPYRYADSAEHREGIAAFLAKRAPKF